MNKLLTKIVGLSLGLSMAVGVGVAVGVNGNEARSVEASQTLTFSLTSNPGDWPTSNSTTLTDYTYTLNDVTYTFSLSNVKQNSGYLMLTQPAALGLPAISGQKLTKVVAHNSSGCSTSTKVGISSSGTSASYISGGEIQTWSTTSSTYTYTLSSTSAATMYYMYVTNKNAQLLSLDLTYESSSTPTQAIIYNAGTTDTVSGLPANGSAEQNTTFTLDSSTTPTRSGYLFMGWAATSGSSSRITTVNVVTSDVNVYAIWSVTGGPNDPYTVAEARAAIDAGYGLVGAYVTGVVSEIVEAYNPSFGNISYNITADGETSSDPLEAYRGKGLNGASFTSAADLLAGDEVVITGTLTKHDSTYEFGAGNYLYSYNRPTPTEPTIVINESSASVSVGNTTTLTATALGVPEGGSVKWYSATTAVATINEDTGVITGVSTGTSEITAKILNSSSVAVATSDPVTVSVTGNALSDGDSFIIYHYVDSTTSQYFTGISSGNIGLYSSTKEDALILTAEEGETSNQFYLRFSDKYLSYSGSDNKIYSNSEKSANTLWTAIDDGVFVTFTNVAVTNRIIKFNTNSGQERFCCYNSSSNSSNINIEKVTAPEVDEVTVIGDPTADAEGAVSVSATFLYEVTYVDPSKPGSSAVTVQILNSDEEAEGASVTTGPADGSFVVTFTASDTYTVTVKSSEDPSKSDSASIVISNIYVPVLTDYKLYAGTSVSEVATLTEGDYIFYYGGDAMTASISSGNRAENTEVTPSDDVISTEAMDIVWHVAPKGSYFTIFNASVNKYLASTGKKNEAALITDGTDDKALWTVSINAGAFEFVNKFNAAAGLNSNIRKNGTYGFACYGTGTGGALSLYKKAYDAVDYSRILLNYLGAVCDTEEGNTNISDLTNSWNILIAEYALLDGTVKAELVDESTSPTVLAALSAYDYVVGKYYVKQGITAIDDFMDRDPDPVGSASLSGFVVDSDNVITIIAIISVISVSAIGGFFFLRKRKEQ